MVDVDGGMLPVADCVGFLHSLGEDQGFIALFLFNSMKFFVFCDVLIKSGIEIGCKTASLTCKGAWVARIPE